ncbi:hypothetical protein [Clostridium sp.]|uniref:hypothetical protein n=1 Tax=Clostridium sp. TaxID=1506 RepID=UPI002914B88F|nr:hypothetical protein [Clostridium sp.]MDU5107966.1 hypothetical protein [Clostridium sp.]
MNEIDFYVSLIDEKEANSILKLCNKSIMSDKLELKKTKIKTIFRGIEPVKKGKKVMNNPFWTCISRHKLDLPLSLTEKEFINYLNEEKNKIPDYKKFAYLRLRFPDNIQDYLERISKNIENNRYIFDFGLEFQTESEIEEYFNKLTYLNNKEELILVMDRLYEIALKNNLIDGNIDEYDNIKNWSLLDIYSEINSLNSTKNLAIKYFFIKSHADINKEILNIFAVDVLVGLLIKFSENKLGIDESKINKYIEEITGIKEYIKKVEQEKKEIDKEYKKYIKYAQKDILNKVTELEALRNKINTLEEEIKLLTEEKEKVNILNNKNTELKTSLNNQKVKCEQLEKRLMAAEGYYEYAFGLEETNNKKIFGIIHSNEMDINITKIIFNEVEFISSDKWKDKVINVNKIYIQRQGITTKKINEIKKYCSECGISNEFISVDNEKTLIEKISILKDNIGGI